VQNTPILYFNQAFQERAHQKRRLNNSFLCKPWKIHEPIVTLCVQADDIKYSSCDPSINVRPMAHSSWSSYIAAFNILCFAFVKKSEYKINRTDTLWRKFNRELLNWFVSFWLIVFSCGFFYDHVADKNIWKSPRESPRLFGPPVQYASFSL
jgi:hypothetical protein